MQVLKAIMAFVLVLSLMWLLSFLIKRFGDSKFMAINRADRRLKLVEHLPIDAKNRLVLVRRDDKEHLLLVSHDHALVVEQGVKAKAEPKEKQNVKN
jgi:flagellar protein FliO/FliZ